MNKFVLKKLSIRDGKDVFNMLQRIKPGKDKFNNEAYGLTYRQYKDWLKKQDNWSKGLDLPKGYVNQTTYWLYINNIPVGYGKLRDKLTNASKKFGGNIGFAIDPSHRGKGYATILLAELLKQARKKNIKKITSTVEKGNLPSKVVHLKCGGVIVHENTDRWFFVFNFEN